MSSTQEGTILLSVRGLSKDYAVRVLDSVDLDLVAGEVHGLIGANGAGKSTLCQILAGNTMPSTGEMLLLGAHFRPQDKRQAEQAGVQIVQQELNLLPSLSVAENLFINRLPHRFGWIDYSRLYRDASIALQRVGLDSLDPRTPVSTLGVGSRQLIEIAAALVAECRLLILDEPTAALTPAEIARLFERVRELKNAGVSVLYVSHRLDEVQTLCDQFHVLRDGRLIESRLTGSSSSDEMVRLMAGEPTEDVTAESFQSHRRDTVALSVDGLCRGDRVRNVTFKVRHGERLGIAGLVGSGRTELLRTIFGADRADSGSVKVADKPPIRFDHPRQAVRAGMALVTEDRTQDGLLLPRSVRINASLAALPHNAGWIDGQAEIREVTDRCTQLDVRTQSIEQPTGELSGGNQQKVVLAKWLALDAEVYLFDEPTRGIDVAARRRIDQLFAELARRGKALLIVSSDLDELMGLCDAVIALSDGRIVERFERSHWSRRALMAAAFGAAHG